MWDLTDPAWHQHVSLLVYLGSLPSVLVLGDLDGDTGDSYSYNPSMLSRSTQVMTTHS